MKKVGKLVQFASYITPEQHKRLIDLKKKTRIPVADFIREAIEHVLKKYERRK